MGISTFPPPSTGGGGVNYYVARFTASGTWTAPAGVSVAEVFVVSGGGGGGAARFTTDSSSGSMGGGGGGGGVVTRIVPITGGSAYTITVGAGGAAGATNAQSRGATGGASSFGTLVSVVGGAGGFNYGFTDAYGEDFASPGGSGANDSGGLPTPATAGGGGGMFPYGRTATYNANTPHGQYGSPSFETGAARGNPGIDGFGAGGGGASKNSGIYNSFFTAGGANAGRGGNVFGIENATSAVANFGGGGGGGGNNNLDVIVAGAGGSGYVEVRYWA